VPIKQKVGDVAVSGALSAVAQAPGFLLDRLGLILLGLSHFHAVGFILLSIGTALYAAAMSSVKAVTLGSKLAGTAS
jgi:cyanate permease